MRSSARAAAILVLAAAPAVFAAPQPDPAALDAVLAARSRNGGFDYRGADGQDRKRLAAYLRNLGDANPASMEVEERKAFWINAYDAAAIQTVLEKYPVKSIRDVDGAFKAVRRRLGGEMLSLDDVENRLRDMKDARVHFAIVCAAKSCPPLRARAYAAAGLSAALDGQARAFLADPARNVLDRARGRLALSKIFDWNRKEFERDGGSIAKYASRYAPDPVLASWLAGFPKEPEFLDYDWALNQP